MLPDRVSNPGPLTYESGALPIALRGPACNELNWSDLDLYFTLLGNELNWSDFDLYFTLLDRLMLDLYFILPVGQFYSLNRICLILAFISCWEDVCNIFNLS